MSGPQSLLLIGVVVPVGGLVVAALARRLAAAWGRQLSIGWAASTLCGVVGASVGAGLAATISGRDARQIPVLVGCAALAGTLVLLVIADRAVRRAGHVPSAVELIGAGESSRVEFKSSARYNRHTGERDPRLELVVAASVAAFSNADGGTLLLGVADDGTVPGLEEDFALVKAPTRDCYELWLRDLLTTTLGAPSAAAVGIDFELAQGREVCLLRVPPAPRPVFLYPPKHAPSEFVVRVGNSSRRLPPHELVEYAGARWRRQALVPRRQRRVARWSSGARSRAAG